MLPETKSKPLVDIDKAWYYMKEFIIHFDCASVLHPKGPFYDPIDDEPGGKLSSLPKDVQKACRSIMNEAVNNDTLTREQFAAYTIYALLLDKLPAPLVTIDEDLEILMRHFANKIPPDFHEAMKKYGGIDFQKFFRTRVYNNFDLSKEYGPYEEILKVYDPSRCVNIDRYLSD